MCVEADPRAQASYSLGVSINVGHHVSCRGLDEGEPVEVLKEGGEPEEVELGVPGDRGRASGGGEVEHVQQPVGELPSPCRAFGKMQDFPQQAF